MILFKKFRALLGILLFLLLSACTTTVTKQTSNNYDVIELPDGSTVYLNKYSSISYPENFNDRNVVLEGEAFFSVVTGNSVFEVSAVDSKISVTGTAFNVKENSDGVEVQVSEGNVELKVQQLVSKIEAGERAAFLNIQKAIKKSKADFEYNKWMDNLEKEFKKMGKEIKKEGRRIMKETRKESDKAEKEISKEVKKLKKILE